MEQAAIDQCQCWGDEDEHVEEQVVTWQDGTQATIPMRCDGMDLDPYSALEEIASTGVFWTETMPVSGQSCTLRRIRGDLWVIESGELDEESQIVAIHGTLAEVLEVWLGEGEAVAPGTSRLLAAWITGSLDGGQAGCHGEWPQSLFVGDNSRESPILEVNVDALTRDEGVLDSLLVTETAWVLSPDTSKDSRVERSRSWRERRA